MDRPLVPQAAAASGDAIGRKGLGFKSTFAMSNTVHALPFLLVAAATLKLWLRSAAPMEVGFAATNGMNTTSPACSKRPACPMPEHSSLLDAKFEIPFELLWSEGTKMSTLFKLPGNPWDVLKGF